MCHFNYIVIARNLNNSHGDLFITLGSMAIRERALIIIYGKCSPTTSNYSIYEIEIPRENIGGKEITYENKFQEK